MKMCEALQVIDELLDSGWYNKPRRAVTKMKDTTLTYKSFNRWALVELGTFLSSCPDHEPIFLLEKYRDIMNRKSCEGKTEEFRFAFTICYEVATEVMDLLLVRGD